MPSPPRNVEYERPVRRGIQLRDESIAAGSRAIKARVERASGGWEVRRYRVAGDVGASACVERDSRAIVIFAAAEIGRIREASPRGIQLRDESITAAFNGAGAAGVVVEIATVIASCRRRPGLSGSLEKRCSQRRMRSRPRRPRSPCPDRRPRPAEVGRVGEAGPDGFSFVTNASSVKSAPRLVSNAPGVVGKSVAPRRSVKMRPRHIGVPGHVYGDVEGVLQGSASPQVRRVGEARVDYERSSGVVRAVDFKLVCTAAGQDVVALDGDALTIDGLVARGRDPAGRRGECRRGGPRRADRQALCSSVGETNVARVGAGRRRNSYLSFSSCTAEDHVDAGPEVAVGRAGGRSAGWCGARSS